MTRTVENWLYAIITLQPEKREKYKKFMMKIAELEQHVHFTDKMNKLSNEAESTIIM